MQPDKDSKHRAMTGRWEAVFQDRQGKPLSGVAVCLRSGRKQGRTDARGRYSCTEMAVFGVQESACHFRVMDPNWAIARYESQVMGQVLQQRFTLVPALSLSGTLRDKRGRPVANTLVCLLRRGPKGAFLECAKVRTGRDGAFLFLQLCPTQYKVRVEVERQPYAELLSGIVSLQSKSVPGLTLTLLPGFTVRGVVREVGSGAPLTGVDLEVETQDRHAIVRHTTTDAQGRYLFRHLPPDNLYQVRVLGSTRQPLSVRRSEMREASVQGKDGEALEKNFLVARPKPLMGRVVDSTGAPVAGASLEVHSKERFFPKVVAQSDAQGHFGVPEEKLGFGNWRKPYLQIRLVVAKAGLRGALIVEARRDSPVVVVLKR